MDPHHIPIEDALDLHTFAPRDIPSVVDEYLRAAHEAGLRDVRLIHGRGVGVQRARVQQVLCQHPLVESYGDAPGSHLGATVARLRSSSSQPNDSGPKIPTKPWQRRTTLLRSSRASVASWASRLRRLSVAVLIGIALGFVVFVATSRGLRSMNGGRVGGDFPAFYAAGSLVAAGRTVSLYDRAEQRRVQAAFLPDHPGGWIDFAYPPPVALAYVPLAQLPFKSAYVIHSVLMAALCVLAVYLLKPVSPLIRENVLVATAATLAFYPIFRAVVGGQNTALSLLCAAGLLASLQRDDRLRAGLWTGAWLFKPQLAIVVALVVGLRRGVRFWLGVAMVGAAYYATAAVMYGPTWPSWWWHEGVVPFLSADIVMDRGNGVSIREVAYELGWPIVGVSLAAVIGILAGWAGVVRSVPAIALVGIASAGAALVSAHALFYDGGLALVAILATAEAKHRNLAIPLSLAWAIALLQPFRQVLPIPPITLTLVMAFAMVLWTVALRPDDVSG